MKRTILIIFVFLCMISCSTEQQAKKTLPKFSVWARQSYFQQHDDVWILKKLKQLSDHNIKGLFLDAQPDFYKRIAPLCKKATMQLHAWKPTMINGSKELMAKHRDWYAVNRNGESCIDKPPYVNYYRLLCPTSEGVKKYLEDKYVSISKIEGVDGIHFDYIRYCDVYLPIGLQPKYGLVQDHEMAEYDFCYCDRCRKLFKEEYGRDPFTMKDPANDLQWRAWRWDKIVEIVNTITPKVKAASGKLATAAVFPTPEIAKRIVRQDWGRFELDAVMPMLYINDYNADIPWIGERIKESIQTMEVKKDIFAGLTVHHLPEPERLKKAVQTAFSAGAKGVVIFDLPAINEQQLQAVKEISSNY